MTAKTIFYILFLNASIQSFAQSIPVAYANPGDIYVQNFNSLPTTGSFTLTGKGPHSLNTSLINAAGLQGWQIMQIAGSQGNTIFSTGTGSSTASSVYSYGLAGNTNRALGSLASGTGTYSFGIVLENQTGLLLNHITIQFLATQFRKGGSTNKNTWRFGYQTGNLIDFDVAELKRDTAFNFISIHTTTGVATLNGQLPANQYLIRAEIKDIRWLPGEKLVLRWEDTDETGSDDAMAIDDFNFSAIQKANQPSISSLLADSVATNYIALKTEVNDQLAETQIQLMFDSSASFSSPISLDSVSHKKIIAGAGNTIIRGFTYGLTPGKNYYFQAKASNSEGTTYSNILQIKTKAESPSIQTDSIIQLTPTNYTLYGRLLNNGGESITEMGFCWSTNDTPTIHHYTTIVHPQTSTLNATIRELAAGTKFYVRSYAINQSGIGYGNTITIFTPTSIESFTTNKYITNQDTILYRLIPKQEVVGIGITDFQIESNKSTDAAIIAVHNDGQAYQLTIYTGTKDALIAPLFKRNSNHQPTVLNAPFQGQQLTIDKTAPYIRSINIPNKSYKAGDSIILTIDTSPEKDTLSFISGDLAKYPITKFHKKNDSIWTAVCYIKTGGLEVLAHQNITTHLIVKDLAENTNHIKAFSIIQNNDAIDLTKPLIDRIEVPEKKIFKAGDSLFFNVRFNEDIKCDTTLGSPVLSITIGTRIKNPFLKEIKASGALLFCYVIQPDELDKDGIRIANTITLNNSVITDLAGNSSINAIPNAGIFSHLTIDAIQPTITNVITPIAKTYGIGDTLSFNIVFSEAIIINEERALPYLNITVANQIYSTQYLKQQATDQVKLYWVVQKDLVDKNGIALSGMLYNTEFIKDSSGNNILTALNGIGALSSIDIDGISPHFIDSISDIDVCMNTTSILEKAGTINDDEKGEIIQWTMVHPPRYGKITGLPYTTKSGTESVYPKGLVYISPDNSMIQDECTIAISDGANTMYKKLKINVNPKITTNQIEQDQIICTGSSPEKLYGRIKYNDDQTHRFIWQIADVKDSSQFTNAAGHFTNETYLPASSYQTTFFRRIVQTKGCTDTSNTVKIEVLSKGLWLGKQSTNWHTGSNWCGAFVPDKHTDVRIIGANNQVSLTDSGFCRSLYLAEHTQLNITGSLLFTESLHGVNNIDASNGTIISNGTAKQILDPILFKGKSIGHLIVNGIELELIDTLCINQSFSIQQGNFISRDMLMLSDKAKIAANAMGSNYEGRINIKKEINGLNKTGLLSHPFKDDIVIHQRSLDSMNSRIEGSSAIVINHNKHTDSIFSLVTKKQITVNNKLEWQPLISNERTNKSSWTSGQSIRLQKLSPPTNTHHDPILLDLTGKPNIGDIDLVFPTFPDTVYYSTGNPYYASIGSLHISISDGIGNYFWVWDTSLAGTGGYAAKAFAGKNTIAPLEGFIIKLTPEKTASLFFSEQSKLEKSIPDSLAGIIENTYQFELSLYRDTVLHDKLLILDVDTARVRFDATDAEKIKNPSSNLFSLSSDYIPLAIDARPLTSKSYIPLGIETQHEGNYTLKFTRVWLEKDITLELHDLYLARKIKISTDSSYQFEITKDTASSGSNRFIIRSPLPPEPLEEPLMLNLFPMPVKDFINVTFSADAPGNTVIMIKNLNGQILRRTALGTQKEGRYQVSVSELRSGQYILELHCGQKFIAKPWIKL